MSSKYFPNATRSALILFAALQTAVQINEAHALHTVIADQPIFVTNSVPPNLMLALSVEWPTGVVSAYKAEATAYTPNNRYLGMFYPEFCYKYYKSSGATTYNTPDTPGTGTPVRNAVAAADEYFRPVANGTGTNNRECTGQAAFSGNFLNWATTHVLDTFRFAMTGGDRSIDTSTKTVLEKARHTGIGGHTQFPVMKILNNSTMVGKVSPFNWSYLNVRVTNGTTELNPFTDNATRGRIIQMNDRSDANFGSGTTYTYLARVQVCDSSAPGLEYDGANDYKLCQGYPVGSASPTVYKPVGLIQKNSDKMRFGATGYLLDSADARAGGVLRARMKSVGPKLVIPNNTTTSNPNAEWDENTGVYVANPDPGDATASSTASGTTISSSGVINYLNKFGKANGYKGKDPFSELYYAALRSLRNLDPVPQYIQSMTSVMYDGFPVITTSVTEPSGPNPALSQLNPLPIQYSCQQNNIVGIADTNCHTDVFVPGNTLSGYTGHPTTGLTDPAVAPNALDVTALGNKIGMLEFNQTSPGTLGTTYQSSSRKNTYHIAALAYWANTKDILVDDVSKPWTAGKQTVKSYFLDVREQGSDGTINNQMWLAAKYGGFEDRNSDGVPATVDTWHTNPDSCSTDSSLCGHTNTLTSAANDGLRPDNFFTGNRPEKLIKSLSDIFNNVLSRSLSGAGASISTINFQSSTANGAYTVQYNAKEWTGDVKGNQITVDSTGTPVVTNVWSAQAKLDTKVSNSGANDGWDAQRKIVTWNTGATPGGVPFRLASLDAAQQTLLGSTATDQQRMLNYLRGEKCHELGNTFVSGCASHLNLYRVRTHLLGDIVSSEATVVGYPEAPYSGLPGYTAFATQYKTTTPRKRIVYVGANDGMLHAFDADVGSPADPGPPAVAAVPPGATAGEELWAYIPSFVLPGPSNPATPELDGLAARAASTSFTHKYYVDATPYVRDVDFKDTKDSTDADNNWKTILVGGLGKGGRGYYAIDVTNPADWTSETAVAGKVLWEFTDEDMGLSFARPVIVRTERDGWVVIVASGYNNTYGSNAANQGKGFLYILNPRTGALIEKISTGVGSASDPSGFAHPAAFLPDSTTFVTDYVYGGDLKGNLWRFDLRGTPTSYSAPTQIAALTDNAATPIPQPITIEPKIEIGANGVDRWVFIGTGKLLDSTDMADHQLQTFYAFRDGSRTQAYGSDSGQTVLPSGITFPANRSYLSEVTNLLDGYLKDDTKPMGWFYNLHTDEKITTPLVANEGLISWNGYVPTTDPCAPGASSNLYVADYDTGLSRLSLSGIPAQYFTSATYLVKLQFVKDVKGKIRAVITTGDPTGGNQISKLEGRFGRTAGTPVRVNWREILD